MRIIRVLFALLLLPLLASCEDAGFTPRELVGEWQFSTETTAIEWSRYDTRLSLADDGTFVRTNDIYSLQGRPGDLLRTSTRAEGTYRTRGNSLVLEISSVERWDVNGVPDTAQQPGNAEERYRARLAGDRLLLEEERDMEGKLVTYYHTFRRVPPPIISLDGAGR